MSMEIPYTVELRRDTMLNNGKIAIWLFLASEVMLFGALFASYILIRTGSPTWPRGDTILTPPLAAGALEGITQDSVVTIARDLGFEARESFIARSDLYIAEEMFVCGTAAEVSAVNSVDDRPIPCPGPKTQAIAEEYAKAVRGQTDRYKTWVEHVDA